MGIEDHWNPQKVNLNSFKESDRKDFEQGSQGNVDRNYGQYELFLGIDFKSMKGKRVLDIGGGVTGKMAKDASEKFGVDVVTMSPEYDPELVSKEAELTNSLQGKLIVGRAQEIPFEDNTFDFELALYSIPMYLPPVISEYEKSLREIIRTLKPAGKAHIFPVKAHFNGELDDPLFSEALKLIGSEITYTHEYTRGSKGINHRVIITKRDSLPDKKEEVI